MAFTALGDHGADVLRPEGDRLVLNGGGILRCRPDGRDLHIFATGLRNIYDIALDDELNVFVRDNENDGGDYKIRVCHSYFGADHGYPYLYWERPSEALAPLPDLGLGSSAGGVSYQETQFPKEYRGNLFFCEWGKSVVRYAPARAGSSFRPLKEMEFAAGADNDPYGFKPTDLVVGYDGSLFVADWADGQRPKRGRGRIYQIRAAGDLALHSMIQTAKAASVQQRLAQLDSPSYYERSQAQIALEKRGAEGLDALSQAKLGVSARQHAVWILAHVRGAAAIDTLIETARMDPDPRVQTQAVRAIADLADPVLSSHRLAAGTGDMELAKRLAGLAVGRDPKVQLEIVVALGRLRWPDAPAWARDAISHPDSALAHALQQMLRRSGNWPEVVKLLDEAHGTPIRAIAFRALAEQAVPEVVAELIDRLAHERAGSRRFEFADALMRVHRLASPQPYWGYRPAPRPPNTVAWIGTAVIEETLDRLLADVDREVRVAVLRRMQRERVPTRPPTLQSCIGEERQPERVRRFGVRRTMPRFWRVLDPNSRARIGNGAAAWAGGLDGASGKNTCRGRQAGRWSVLADLLRSQPQLRAERSWDRHVASTRCACRRNGRPRGSARRRSQCRCACVVERCNGIGSASGSRRGRKTSTGRSGRAALTVDA